MGSDRNQALACKTDGLGICDIGVGWPRKMVERLMVNGFFCMLDGRGWLL